MLENFHNEMEKIWSKLIYESMCILLYTNDILTKKKEDKKSEEIWLIVRARTLKWNYIHSIPQTQPEVASSPAQTQT